MTVKLFSWNVNGLRAIVKRNQLKPFIDLVKPDVLCLQEVKIDDVRRAEVSFDFAGYTEYFNSAKRPGYSGTATLVKEGREQPKVTNGLNVKGSEEFDSEGRVQTLEFRKFFLLNVYFPNSREDLSRVDFKIEFNELLHKHIKKLDKIKPVIITGDYNVAHNEIDLARPKENDGKHGFHPRERAWFTKHLEAGFADSFRQMHPKEIKYSWWSTRFGQAARIKNVGWRIDYFTLSSRLAKSIKKAEIHDQVLGSDHAPVSLDIEI